MGVFFQDKTDQRPTMQSKKWENKMDLVSKLERVTLIAAVCTCGQAVLGVVGEVEG